MSFILGQDFYTLFLFFPPIEMLSIILKNDSADLEAAYVMSVGNSELSVSQLDVVHVA